MMDKQRKFSEKKTNKKSTVAADYSSYYLEAEEPYSVDDVVFSVCSSGW